MVAKIWNSSYWIKETDPTVLFEHYKKALETAGFKVLENMQYHFEPYGYTCLFLIAESHLAIHTFPEENKTYIELSSCNEEKHLKFEKIDTFEKVE